MHASQYAVEKKKEGATWLWYMHRCVIVRQGGNIRYTFVIFCCVAPALVVFFLIFFHLRHSAVAIFFTWYLVFFVLTLYMFVFRFSGFCVFINDVTYCSSCLVIEVWLHAVQRLQWHLTENLDCFNKKKNCLVLVYFYRRSVLLSSLIFPPNRNSGKLMYCIVI